LTRGLLVERARELLSADDRPVRTGTMIALLKLAFVLSFIAGAIGLGLGIRRMTGPWSDSAREIGTVMFMLWVIVYFVALFRARRKPWSSSEPPYDPATGAVLLASLFASLAFVVAGQLLASDDPSLHGGFAWYSVYSPWTNLFLYTNFLTDLCASLWPSRQLLRSFAELRGAEQQLRSGQQWVDGCHEMIAKGVPSPLAEAEAQVVLATRRRDEIKERIHSLGYRARFRQDLGGPVAA
jgi:hypothetical protein